MVPKHLNASREAMPSALEVAQGQGASLFPRAGARLSRRKLLASGSAAAVALMMGGRGAGAAAPGRVNLGLNGITYYSLGYPFLNAWKCGAPIQVVAGGVNYWSNITPGLANSAWDRFLDSDGELVRPMPLAVASLLRVFFAPPSDGIPAGYNRMGERWVLKWDGVARDVKIVGAGGMRRTGNRILWVWGADVSNMWIVFSGFDHRSPPRNIRLCEARHEEALDAGEIFHPDWLAIVRRGSGIVRFMDWQNTNFNASTLRMSDIPRDTYFSYGGSTRTPFVKGGMPLSIMSDLANKVQAHPWVCIPNVLGTKNVSSIAAISNAKPAVVRSPGHQLEDGDIVIPLGTNWPEIEKTAHTVRAANKQDGTFVLEGVDASAFPTLSSSWASLTTPFDLAAMTKEVSEFVGHFRDSVAAPLVTYFEFGNETWNWAFSAPHWFAAQSRHKFGREDAYRMSGYLSAHCMRVVSEVYGAKGRDRWRGVLATQTGNPDVTKQLLEGAKLYLREHARALKLSDIVNELAVAGYFGGNLENAHKATVFTWMDDSERRWATGREPNRFAYFNRMVNEDLRDGRHTKIPLALDKVETFWRAHKALADAEGLGLIQYEGGNSNFPGFFNSLNPNERNRVMEFFRASCHTPEDAANYKTMFESFVALGGRYPSKFVEFGPVSRYGNWGGLRHFGDRNPVWDTVVAFNNRT